MAEHLYFLIFLFTLIHYFYNFATSINSLGYSSYNTDNELPNNGNN